MPPVTADVSLTTITLATIANTNVEDHSGGAHPITEDLSTILIAKKPTYHSDNLSIPIIFHSKGNVELTTTGTTLYNNQRRIIKTSDNKYSIFVTNTSTHNIQYSVLNDVVSDLVDSGVNCYHPYGFDVCNNGDTAYFIYHTYSTGSTYVRFVKATYSTTTESWSMGTPVNVQSGYSSQNKVNICRLTSGRLWVTSNWATYDSIGAYYSDDEGATWTKKFIYAGYANETAVFENVGNGFCIFTDDYEGYIQSAIYTTAWSAHTDIVTNYSGFPSATMIGTNVYMTTATTTGIKVFIYDSVAATWDAGTVLSSIATDAEPVVGNISGQPIAYWVSGGNIVYRLFNGTSWDAAEYITIGAVVKSSPSCMHDSDADIRVFYTTAAGEVYYVYLSNNPIIFYSRLTAEPIIFHDGLPRRRVRIAISDNVIDLPTNVDSETYNTESPETITVIDNVIDLPTNVDSET